MAPPNENMMIGGKTVRNGKKRGTGVVNENKPFGNNPFVYTPGDIDENPFRLVWLDVLSVFQKSYLLSQIILPLWPTLTKPASGLEELSLTPSNMMDMVCHMSLLGIQLFIIATLPIMLGLFWFLPGIIYLVYFLIFFSATMIAMRLLNGRRTSECLVGLPTDGLPVNDEEELWFFINGVATGYEVLEHPPYWKHDLTPIKGRTGCRAT